MDTIIRHIYFALAHLGGFGLLILSTVDASPLFLPFGNDLLMAALAAANHKLMLYYAAMAAAGSTLGCLLVDIPSRKGGEKGFERTVSPKRFNSIKKKVKQDAAWALICRACSLYCLITPAARLCIEPLESNRIAMWLTMLFCVSYLICSP